MSLAPTTSASFRTILAGLAFWPGLILLAGLFASRLIFPAQSISFAAKLLDSLVLANTAFDSPQLFYSHLWRNVLLFASFLTMSGVVLRVSLCPIYLPRDIPRSRFVATRNLRAKPSAQTVESEIPRHYVTRNDMGIAIWKPLLLIVIVLDLFAGAIGFNPSVDPQLLDYTPPVIGFLKQDQAPWRFTTFDPNGRKTINANGGWPYGLPDVRSYDSIILKQYADYMGVIEDQNERQFNRIQPITTYGSGNRPKIKDGRGSPLLDCAPVRSRPSRQ